MKRARPLALLCSLSLALGCAGVKQKTGETGSTGAGNSTGSGGTGATYNNPPPPTACSGVCTDFPAAPISSGNGVPSNAAQIFGAAGSGNSSGGPCLYEPQTGTLFPDNWLRPRFSWTAPSGQNLFELRLHTNNQANDLVVYTTNTSWTMNSDDMTNPPASQKAMWVALAGHTQDTPISVTVRGASTGGGTPSAGNTNIFTIAPVEAAGNLVYWSPSGSTNAGTGKVGQTVLSGFAVGDEGVTPVLVPTDVSTSWETVDQAWNVRTPSESGPAVSCIGCHTSTPDGNFIGFNDTYPWGGVLASGQPGALHGTSPSFVNIGGYAAFTQPWVGIQTYSANHWTDGPPSEHIVVAPLGSTGSNDNDGDQQPGLAWFDLESTTAPLPKGQSSFNTLKGTAWNWIFPPTTGQYAAAPSWSHQPGNDFIIFTGTSNVKSGRMGTGGAHLYKVPYSKTAQQVATPIVGDGTNTLSDVSSSKYAQYYGTLSSDDKLIVYDQISYTLASAEHADLNGSDPPGSTWSGMYMQPATELFAMPAGGGSGTRLAANDPPLCPGQLASPGINNTWAKWSPEVSASNGSTYYWLIFSSWRQGMKDANGDPIAQLFMTAIVQPEAGPIATYPAIYLWNQPATVSNFTPAWDVFKIPIVIDTGI
jgi:hypothetical protein